MGEPTLLLYPLIGIRYSHSACLSVYTSSPRSVGVTAAAWIWGEGQKRVEGGRASHFRASSCASCVA